MPIAQPVSQLDPPPNPADHQRYSEFAPKVFYDLSVQEVTQKFHPAMPATTLWGYGGNVPGPTIMAHYGDPVLLRIRNLPANHVGFGLPSIATHLHNGHNASESDGYPADFVDAGAFRDHHYPNWPAGGDPREVMNTLWYHDHREDFTAQNVVRGLAAFYLLFDELDSGNENDPNENAFHLPSGAYDIPMMFKTAPTGPTDNSSTTLALLPVPSQQWPRLHPDQQRRKHAALADSGSQCHAERGRPRRGDRRFLWSQEGRSDLSGQQHGTT
jgi:hypothetical protein